MIIKIDFEEWEKGMIVSVILLYALFGLSFTLGKMLLFHASPFFVIAVRMLIGGFFLLGYTFFTQRENCYPKKDDWILHLKVALFGIYLFYSLRAWGLQYITTTKAALLCNFLPFFTAIASYIHWKERLELHQMVGLLIGFFGMLILIVPHDISASTISWTGLMSLPEMMIIVAVASLGYSITLTQQLVRHRQCPPPLVNGMSMVIGGFFAMISAFLCEPIWIRGDGMTLTFLFILQIIISNFICANLHASLLRHYSATFMAFAGFLSPICTIIYGYIFFQETTNLNFFVSFFLVLSGLFVYHYKIDYVQRVKTMFLRVR